MEKEVALKKIGIQIQKLREEKGISQQVLAAMCNYDKSNMSRIEAGKTNFTVNTLLKVSNALNVKLKDIVDIGD
ncbi:MAG: helix-turn-helix domain-containing protein [Bacteroidales bacterium]|jgi:transcriptional regulator with XRE-family HTH domain|nr:helix-turn-helix domain-containing protein [Bacteroidales bacterium]